MCIIDESLLLTPPSSSDTMTCPVRCVDLNSTYLNTHGTLQLEALRLSIFSIKNLTNDLLPDNYTFVLTGKFNQDCIDVVFAPLKEKLFGALMIQNPKEITPVTDPLLTEDKYPRFHSISNVNNDKTSKTEEDEVALKVKNIRFITCVHKFFTSAIDFYMHWLF